MVPHGLTHSSFAHTVFVSVFGKGSGTWGRAEIPREEVSVEQTRAEEGRILRWLRGADFSLAIGQNGQRPSFPHSQLNLKQFLTFCNNTHE